MTHRLLRWLHSRRNPPEAPLRLLPPAQGQTTVASDVTNQAIERIVIKNANLTISVSDPSKSMVTISKMAEDMGGFVVSANVYKETLSSGAEVPRASITVRVPAEKVECRPGPDPGGEQTDPDQREHEQPGCDQRIRRPAEPPEKPGSG